MHWVGLQCVIVVFPDHTHLLKDIIKLVKHSKFYHRNSESIVKYNSSLKTLLQQGILEPVFYGDLVYKFKRIVRNPNFSDQFKKIIKRYKKKVGYNMDIMRQSACLVVNPIMVYSYEFLFNCTVVGLASDSMMVLALRFKRLVDA